MSCRRLQAWFTLFTLRDRPDASAVVMMVLDRKGRPLQRGKRGCAQSNQFKLTMVLNRLCQ